MGVWYLDDGSLVGRVENLEGMLAYLEERFRGIGLAINFGKCHILTSYGSLDSFPLLSRVARHDLSEEDGIRVLGSPVGGDHYIASFLGGCVDKVGKFCQRVVALRMSQLGVSLLQGFVMLLIC